MYCEADLRPFAKYVTKDHPLKILNGQPLVLLDLHSWRLRQ